MIYVDCYFLQGRSASRCPAATYECETFAEAEECKAVMEKHFDRVTINKTSVGQSPVPWKLVLAGRGAINR